MIDLRLKRLAEILVRSFHACTTGRLGTDQRHPRGPAIGT